jgi:hypothetical protein
LKGPPLFGTFFFYSDSQHAFCLPESPICEVPSRFRILIPTHSHVDFCAIPSKLDLIHAISHKMNSSFAVFPQVLWYWDSMQSIGRLRTWFLFPQMGQVMRIKFQGGTSGDDALADCQPVGTSSIVLEFLKEPSVVGG